MKYVLSVLALALGLAVSANAAVEIGFNDAYDTATDGGGHPIGGIASNLANAAGVVTNNMTWGIVIDTSGNGFSASYDPYAGGVATAGYLSSGGSVTDDYYVPGTTTVDGTNSGYLEGDLSTVPGNGSILDDLTVTLSGAITSGKPFALIWFSNNTSANGSKYGFLTDATFLLPGDGNTTEFGKPFVGNDPIRTASHTFGTVVTSATIAVYDGNGTGGNLRTDNTGTYTVPTTTVGSSSAAQTFTIQNTGGTTLTLNSITEDQSGNPGDFVVSTPGSTSLAANATTTFTVTFSPTATGTRTALVQVASTDSSTPLFRINVSGSAVAATAPKLSLFDGTGTGGATRANNSTFSFTPTIVSGTSGAQTFTISNTGTAALTNLAVSKGASGNPGDFAVDAGALATSLTPGSVTTFTVTFNPTAVGLRSATVLIASNDSTANPFTINVGGSSVQQSGPQISVFKGGTPAGAGLASGAAVSMASAAVGFSSSQTFTIQNTGTSDLNNLDISLAGSGNPGDYALGALSDTTLAANATATFTVTFTPSAVGTRSAVVQIASNDPNTPFTIALSGQTNTLSFDSAGQSPVEHATTLTIPVRLSAATGLSLTKGFTVPLTFGGTATKTNYTHVPASPAATPNTATLTFAANKTVANLTITLIDDKIISLPDKTITVTLGTPSLAGIGLGLYPTYTITIMDADTPPTITAGTPVNQMVKVGDPVTFTSGATGSNPLTFLWKKNGAALAGATSTTLNLTNAATTANAGAYSFTATNYKAAATATAQLAVVDTTASTLRYNVGTTATMTVNAAGNSLTYQWQKNGANVSDTRITGATGKTLTIKTLVGTDAGAYTCIVSALGHSQTSGTFTLEVPTAKPTPPTPSFPDCVINNAYSYQIPYDSNVADENQVPTKFVCTSLPPGLTCNATTGLVTGKATKTGTYTVAVVLSNTAGGATIPVTSTMTVYAFPTTCVGTYTGIIGRDFHVNANLGGRVDIATTSTGAFSGTLKLGGTSYTLKSTMVTAAPVSGGSTPHPGITMTIPRTKDTPAVLTLDLDPDTNVLAGSVSVNSGVNLMSIDGWRNVWHTTAPANPVTTQLGTHAFNLLIDHNNVGVAGMPQGNGYGTIVVTAAGGTTVSGHAPDGQVFTSVGVLSPGGEVILYQTMYSNKGSILNAINIASDSTHTVAGSVDWAKQTSVVARDYGAFGPTTLTMTGGKYVSAAPVLGLTVPGTGNDAQLLFAQGGLSKSAIDPYVKLRIASNNAVTITTVAGSNPATTTANPNLGKITGLTLSASSGAFSGKFTLTDTVAGKVVTRTVTFQGQIVSTLNKGFGYFLLPQLADSTAVPPTTASNSPILAGSVVLQAWP